MPKNQCNLGFPGHNLKFTQIGPIVAGFEICPLKKAGPLYVHWENLVVGEQEINGNLVSYA